MTKLEKGETFASKLYGFVSFWLMLAITGTLVFFGAMWFTTGVDETVRYVTSATVTVLLLEKIFSRLFK
jgi:hypothetical protein